MAALRVAHHRRIYACILTGSLEPHEPEIGAGRLTRPLHALGRLPIDARDERLLICNAAPLLEELARGDLEVANLVRNGGPTAAASPGFPLLLAWNSRSFLFVLNQFHQTTTGYGGQPTTERARDASKMETAAYHLRAVRSG